MNRVDAIKRAHGRVMLKREREAAEKQPEKRRESNPAWRWRYCDWCGKEYIPEPRKMGDGKRNQYIYCSPECADNGNYAALQIAYAKVRCKRGKKRNSPRWSRKPLSEWKRIIQETMPPDKWFRVFDLVKASKMNREKCVGALEELLHEGFLIQQILNTNLILWKIKTPDL